MMLCVLFLDCANSLLLSNNQAGGFAFSWSVLKVKSTVIHFARTLQTP